MTYTYFDHDGNLLRASGYDERGKVYFDFEVARDGRWEPYPIDITDLRHEASFLSPQGAEQLAKLVGVTL